MFLLDFKLVIAGIFIAILIILAIFLLVKRYLYYPIKAYIFGYRLYQYEKIYSAGGTGIETKWHKTDEKALKDFEWFEFVDVIYPVKYTKRIKPSR